MPPYAVYLHIPFCIHRCGYCDFNTYAGLEDLIPAYTAALVREIALVASSAGERLPVQSIFFGGGTPSLLSGAQLASILRTLEEAYQWLPEIEITLEANPGTVSLASLQEMRRLGVNRLSLGMQSAHPGELRLLERQHDYSQVVSAVTAARQAGFDNLNLDLIYGLPEQALATWQHSLELALGLHPEHLSLYALSIEHGTPLKRWATRGLISEPDPDQAAEMYEWADERLTAAGYEQYEISNWSKVQHACRHNLQYWRGLPYLGLGAGAHGYANGARTANVLAPAAYIARLNDDAVQEFPRTPATASLTQVDRTAEIGETMMMGLRLTREGVSEADFQARFGQDLEEMFAGEINELQGYGLLEWAGEAPQRHLRLTPRGRLLGNQVFMRFI